MTTDNHSKDSTPQDWFRIKKKEKQDDTFTVKFFLKAVSNEIYNLEIIRLEEDTTVYNHYGDTEMDTETMSRIESPFEESRDIVGLVSTEKGVISPQDRLKDKTVNNKKTGRNKAGCEFQRELDEYMQITEQFIRSTFWGQVVVDKQLRKFKKKSRISTEITSVSGESSSPHEQIPISNEAHDGRTSKRKHKSRTILEEIKQLRQIRENELELKKNQTYEKHLKYVESFIEKKKVEEFETCWAKKEDFMGNIKYYHIFILWKKLEESVVKTSLTIPQEKLNMEEVREIHNLPGDIIILGGEWMDEILNNNIQNDNIVPAGHLATNAFVAGTSVDIVTLKSLTLQ
ncbi:hypothetical protein JTB14_029179 [Gonioctena quinquepunctata]|nr:hypothetical protein JTB14_029179 [Gonioctena quinquepunctata]